LNLGLLHPDVKVLAAMAGRGVHEAGTGIVGDVVAVEQGDGECVSTGKPLRGWANHALKFGRRHISQRACKLSLALLRMTHRQAHRQRSAFAGLWPKVILRRGHFVEAVGDTVE
jgi:hypothetical protein